MIVSIILSFLTFIILIFTSVIGTKTENKINIYGIITIIIGALIGIFNIIQSKDNQDLMKQLEYAPYILDKYDISIKVEAYLELGSLVEDSKILENCPEEIILKSPAKLGLLNIDFSLERINDVLRIRSMRNPSTSVVYTSKNLSIDDIGYEDRELRYQYIWELNNHDFRFNFPNNEFKIIEDTEGWWFRVYLQIKNISDWEDVDDEGNFSLKLEKLNKEIFIQE